jgi:hypothetical protein
MTGEKTNDTKQEKCSYTFLDVLAKLQISTISFVMYVRPSVRMEQLGSHGRDFHEIWYCIIFLKIYRENSSIVKSD